MFVQMCVMSARVKPCLSTVCGTCGNLGSQRTRGKEELERASITSWLAGLHLNNHVVFKNN